MILAVVSSKESFWHEVLEVLDSRVRRDATWNLNYDEVSRLRTLGPAEQCVLIIDFGDSAQIQLAARLACGG